MRAAVSLVHLLSGGLVLSLGWLAAALFCAIFPATRPLAVSCWRLAGYNLYPFGRELVRERDIQQFQDHLRTGTLPQGSKTRMDLRGIGIGQALLWAPVGAILVGAHLLHGLLVSLLFSSNPWRTRSFALLGPALLPVGWEVASTTSGRGNFISRSRGLPCRRPARREPLPIRQITRSAGATAGGAMLMLWASFSATGPLIQPGRAGIDGASTAFALARIQNPMPAGLYRIRPEANPPLPLRRGPPPAAAAKERCGAPGAALADRRLARRHLDHALPLGSAPVPVRPAILPVRAVQRAERMQALAATLRYAKARGAECLPDLAERALRSASFGARKAEAARLARKAAPDVILASVGPSPMFGDARRRHRVESRRLEALGRMAALISPAKARENLLLKDAAARVGRTAGLRSAMPSGVTVQ